MVKGVFWLVAPFFPTSYHLPRFSPGGTCSFIAMHIHTFLIASRSDTFVHPSQCVSSANHLLAGLPSKKAPGKSFSIQTTSFILYLLTCERHLHFTFRHPSTVFCCIFLTEGGIFMSKCVKSISHNGELGFISKSFLSFFWVSLKQFSVYEKDAIGFSFAFIKPHKKQYWGSKGHGSEPFLFTLRSADFQYRSEFCHIQKYSDGTAVVGSIRNGQIISRTLLSLNQEPSTTELHSSTTIPKDQANCESSHSPSSGCSNVGV